MKTRARVKSAQNGVRIVVVPIEGATRLVTLEDPGAPVGDAEGAFARLRPPADFPANETAAWKAKIRASAIAVQVESTRRAAPIAAADARAANAGLAYRDVVRTMAEETGYASVIEVVDEVMELVSL